MPTIKITDTPANSECVTLAEAKAHLRVDVADDDALITGLITAARLEAEHQSESTLVETVLELQLDAFPCRSCIRLDKGPFQAVTSVKYYDSSNTLQTLSAALYFADLATGRIVLAPGASWPSTYQRPAAVQVRYTAGLPLADKAKVSEAVKAWIKLRVETLYENRGQLAIGVEVNKIPFVGNLLDTAKNWSA